MVPMAAGKGARDRDAPVRHRRLPLLISRLQLYEEIEDLGHEHEARPRAIEYVQMARRAGIGTLVLQMPTEDKRRFFRAAFKSIGLDGHGRGLRRTRSVKTYELSDALDTFILQHASACVFQEQGIVVILAKATAFFAKETTR